MTRAPRTRRAIDVPEAVRVEWLNRVEAEYRSATIVQQLTLWLMKIGASPDLIDLGLRIAADEMAHADLSFNAYAAAGGGGGPRLARETLGLAQTGDALELDVVRACVDVFCLGETIAVPLFKELREGCTVPVARRALDRILRDEVRHRDFGWQLLAWLFTLPIEAELRAVVARELPGYFRRVRLTYAPPGASARTTIGDVERSWGLMAPAAYGRVVERCIERDWAPRFEGVGVDARAAWDEAKRRG